MGLQSTPQTTLTRERPNDRRRLFSLTIKCCLRGISSQEALILALISAGRAKSSTSSGQREISKWAERNSKVSPVTGLIMWARVHKERQGWFTLRTKCCPREGLMVGAVMATRTWENRVK